MNALAVLRPVRRALVAAVVLQALASAVVLLPLVVIVELVVGLLAGDRPAPMLIVWAVAGLLAAPVLSGAANWLTHRADARVSHSLQQRLVARIRLAPLHEVTGAGAGAFTRLVQGDIGALHHLVAHTLLDVTAFVVTPTASLLLLAAIDWRLALLAAVPLALGSWWFVVAMRGSASRFIEFADAQRRISGAIAAFVRGLPTAKLYDGDHGLRSRYQRAVHDFHDFFRAWSGGTAVATTASWLVVAPGLTAPTLALVGAVGVGSGWLTPEAAVAGALLGPAVSGPVAVVGPRVQAVRAGIGAAIAIRDALARPTLAWADGVAPERPSPLRATSVTARYPGAADNALVGIDLELRTHGLVALVGASGAGKSSLVAALARLADPASGTVSIGNAPLSSLAELDVRRRIAIVGQDVAVPRTSIRALLQAGGNASDDAVHHVLGRTALADVVAALPAGLDAVLGDDAILSGGQRQRLLVARALLAEPDHLLLDEPFSALDEDTRHRVLTTLRDEASRRCIVLVAHQMDLVRRADRIVVLDAGAIVGDGTHEHLLETCQRYRALAAPMGAR